MDEVTNPYVPGAGRPPAALVGRDGPIRAWEASLLRAEDNRSAQSIALYGLRGVGKTVLLRRLTMMAEDRGWIVAQVEAGIGKGLRNMLTDGLHAPLVDMAKPRTGTRLLKGLKTASTFFRASMSAEGTWVFGVDLSDVSGGGADTGLLETDLTKLVIDLSEGAREQGAGLAILIDEAQDLTLDELTALCAIVHLASQRQLACVVALAGLPSLPRMLAEAKSYSERLFRFDRIEHLDRGLSEKAIVEPAENEGVSWDNDALAYVVAESAGYPYFLQQFGQSAWNEAESSPIRLTDARVGTSEGRRILDAGFFRSRWDRATTAEQKYLRAMSEDGDRGTLSRDLATRLGRNVQSIGPSRANLISKGLVYASDHGVVSFTVPGMAAFIAREVGE